MGLRGGGGQVPPVPRAGYGPEGGVGEGCTCPQCPMQAMGLGGGGGRVHVPPVSHAGYGPEGGGGGRVHVPPVPHAGYGPEGGGGGSAPSIPCRLWA